MGLSSKSCPSPCLDPSWVPQFGIVRPAVRIRLLVGIEVECSMPSHSGCPGCAEMCHPQVLRLLVRRLGVIGAFGI